MAESQISSNFTNHDVRDTRSKWHLASVEARVHVNVHFMRRIYTAMALAAGAHRMTRPLASALVGMAATGGRAGGRLRTPFNPFRETPVAPAPRHRTTHTGTAAAAPALQTAAGGRRGRGGATPAFGKHSAGMSAGGLRGGRPRYPAQCAEARTMNVLGGAHTTLNGHLTQSRYRRHSDSNISRRSRPHGYPSRVPSVLHVLRHTVKTIINELYRHSRQSAHPAGPSRELTRGPRRLPRRNHCSSSCTCIMSPQSLVRFGRGVRSCRSVRLVMSFSIHTTCSARARDRGSHRQ